MGLFMLYGAISKRLHVSMSHLQDVITS